MGGPTKKNDYPLSLDFRHHKIIGSALSDPNGLIQSVSQSSDGEISLEISDYLSPAFANSAIFSWRLKDIIGKDVSHPLSYADWIVDTTSFPGVSSQVWVAAGIANAPTYAGMTWAMLSGLLYSTIGGTPRHKYGTRTVWSISAELPLTQSRVFGKSVFMNSSTSLNQSWIHQMVSGRIVTTTGLTAGLAATGFGLEAAVDPYFIIAVGKEATNGNFTQSIGIKVGKRIIGTPASGLVVT